MATLPFAPPADDASVQILQSIFGSPVYNMVTDTQDTETTMQFVGALLNAFNVGLLVIAGIIASYIAIVGTANTANDGQALGKQWSSTWTPVRIVASAAVLLPTATGFSFIQLFVLACALWGANLANQVYTAALDHIFVSKTFINHEAVDRSTDYAIVGNALKQHLCARILHDKASKQNITLVGGSTALTAMGALDQFMFSIGEPKASDKNTAKNSTCGYVKYTPDSDLKINDSPETIKGNVYLAGVLQNTSKKMRTQLVERRLVLHALMYADIAANGAIGGGPNDIINSFMDESASCFVNAQGTTGNTQECLKFWGTREKIKSLLTTADTLLYSQGTQNNLESIQQRLVDGLTADLTLRGWAMSPGWFQKVSSVVNRYATSIGTITLPHQETPSSLPFFLGISRTDADTLYTAAARAIDETIESIIAEKRGEATSSSGRAHAKIGASSDEIILERNGRISDTLDSLKRFIDLLPNYLIYSLMPDYDAALVDANGKGISYTTAKGSDLPQSVQKWMQRAATAARNTYYSARATLLGSRSEHLFTKESPEGQSIAGLWYCQKNVLGMGSSLFRAQCVAETALHITDTIGGMVARTVENFAKQAGFTNKTSKGLAAVTQFGLSTLSEAPVSSNIADVGLQQAATWDNQIGSLIRLIGVRLEGLRMPLVFVAAGLPILPYFVFIFGVVGWVLGVLQALIAAPLWACLHMTPGQSFIGSERQGYMLLLSLFVRPALLVFGLLIAFWVCDPLVEYYINAFLEMQSNVTVQSLSRDNLATAAMGQLGLIQGILSEPGLRLLFFFVGLMSIFTTVFLLAQSLPNAVLKWLNMNVEDLGASHGSEVLKTRTARGAGADSFGGELRKPGDIAAAHRAVSGHKGNPA